MTLVPLTNPTLAVHDVLPDAVPVPPRLLTQVTCDTLTLSEADPPMLRDPDEVEYDDEDVGEVMLMDGAVPSGATMVHVNVLTAESTPSKTVTLTV
jgi:hypothetical protein